MRIYYAHFIGIYNTKQEERDLQTLKTLFPEAEIVNPGSQQIQEDYKKSLLQNPKSAPMDFFCDLVKTCDTLVFRGCVNGKIGAGIWKEIQTAVDLDMPVLELPSYLSREMSVEETKQLLKEFGVR